MYGWLSMCDGQRAHPVCFEPEAELELVRGKSFVVVRAVVARRTVRAAAPVDDETEVLSLAHVGRALEHHVLEEVREPRAPLDLVSRANVVVDGHRDSRDGVVWVHHHTQAVVECRAAHLQVREGGGVLPRTSVCEPPRVREPQ